MAFAEGQFPSENPISSSEGFKTSSKYDGNNCLWIFPRTLGGIFFSLSLENETLLGRKSLEKELTHSSACDNLTMVLLLGSQRA